MVIYENLMIYNENFMIKLYLSKNINITYYLYYRLKIIFLTNFNNTILYLFYK